MVKNYTKKPPLLARFREIGLTILLVMTLFLTTNIMFGQTVVLSSWDFTAKGGQSSVATTEVAVGISTTAPSAVASLGSGFWANDYLSNGLTVIGQTSFTLADAIARNEYITFTVAPSNGSTLTITEIKLRPVSQNRARSFAIFSSKNGFAEANLISTISVPEGNDKLPLQTIAITGHTSIATATEFRIYVYGHNNGYESVGFGNRQPGLAEKDLQISGTVQNPADIQAPSAPTALTTSAVTSTSFTLAWTASTDDYGVASYEVFDGATSLGTTTTNSISLTNLTASTTYAMTVKAKDNAGNVSLSSAALNVTTLDTPIIPPTNRTNNIGINTPMPALDWGVDKVFADAMRSSRNCSKTTNWNTDNANKDANYWPTEDCVFIVYADLYTNNNHGTYKLSFTGQATISTYDNAGVISNKLYNSSTNTTTADLIISDPNNSRLSIVFTNTKRTSADATNTGITNIKLMRPLTPGSTSSYPITSLFMDDYINQLAPYKCIRSLGWLAINWNQDAVWADRTLMQHSRQSPPTGGKPYGWENRGASLESLILFANQAQKDVWLNLPHLADDDYITKVAQLFKYGSDGVTPYTSTQANPVYPPLNPDLKLYVEYSNEIWNDQFSQTHANYEKALTNDEVKFDGVTEKYELGMRYKGLRTVQISNIFRNVFGDSEMMTKVRPVIATQKGYQNRSYQTMEFLDRYYAKRDYRSTWNDPHPVNYYIYGFGGSFYWYTDGSAVTTETIWTSGSWDATKSFVNQSGNQEGFYDQTAWDGGIAKQYGLAYVLYEGDLHPTYQNGDDEVIKQLHTGVWDSRMTQNTLDHLNVLNQVDAELYLFLQNNGGTGSTWAVRNVLNPSNSPKLDAINIFNAATPLPITLGSVAPFTRAGNAYDNRGTESRNPNGTGSTTLTAITGTWGSSLSSSYLFRVNSTGTYTVQVQYSTTAAAILAVELNGNVVATYNLNNTGGATALTSLANISCSTDKLHSIRLVCTSGAVNIININVGTDGLGIDTNTQSNSVGLYPNPATDYITVELPNILENDNTNITLSDMTGKVVYKNTVSKVNSLQIETSNLTKGMYIISVNSGTKNYYKKLIIK